MSLWSTVLWTVARRSWMTKNAEPKQVPPEATPLQLVFLLSGDPSAPVDVELQNGLNSLSFF